MKNWMKAVIGVGAAAVGGIVTLGILGRDEKIETIDADFEEVDTDDQDTTEEDTDKTE